MRVVALVVGAVAVAVLGVLARDHATPPPPVAPPLDAAAVRAEVAHMLARTSTVPPESDVPSDVTRDAFERVLVGSDPPGADATPIAAVKDGEA